MKPRPIEILTQRPIWTSALLDAIGRGEISASSLNVNQVRKLGSIKDKALGDRVKQVWGTVREARNPGPRAGHRTDEVELEKRPGRPRPPARLSSRTSAASATRSTAKGMDVGPDVTLNGRGSYEQLLSNVFDPSLVIGPGPIQATTMATVDGRVLTGLVVEDSPQRVVLKLQGGKTETLWRGRISRNPRSARSR